MKHVHLNKQRGVVLLVALIALVALSLSGIALMRSVDTSNIVSGNFAFNEATTQMAEIGVQEAQNFIAGNLYENGVSRALNNCNAAGPSLPNGAAAVATGISTTVPNGTYSNLNPGRAAGCPHFYSTYFTDINPTTNLPTNFPPNGWSPTIDVPNLPVNCQATPGSCDYTVQYFIERMCSRETWKWDTALAPAASAVGGLVNGILTTGWQPGAPTFTACLATPIYDNAIPPAPIVNRGRLYYRITVQVNGPRNTRSLMQYYVGMDDDVLSTAP